jgi:hypothetical protein
MTPPTPFADNIDPAAEKWQTAATYLQPEKSVERIVASAKYVITSVTIVATVLTAVGTLKAEEFAADPILKLLATSTGIVVSGAILLAYLPLIMRTKDVQVENLLEVERWFKSEMEKGRFVRSAGIFLSLAVVLAVITAVVAAVGREDPHAAVSIVETGFGTQQKVVVTVTVPSPSQDPLTVLVTASRGTERLVLLQSTHSKVLAGRTTVLNQTVEGVQGFQCFAAEVRYGNRVTKQSLGCPG